ncbi:MAG TPA: alpha-L-rhamnosidase N-terminal domain-containing protein, partial [Pengzhenrongella sp.]
MSASEAPTALRVENHPVSGRVLGIGEARPRFSWQVPGAPSGWRQTAYEVEITRGDAAERTVVETDAQLFVPWPGRPLASREVAGVRVRARDDDWSPWSKPVVVEAGLLVPGDWTARFVSPVAGAGLDDAAPLLRGTWQVPDGVVAARLYVTAQGLYEARINGVRVGDHELAPGWTSYQHRLRYQTFDVTDLLRAGANEAEVLLGNGWWRGHLTWSMRRALYGDRLALL